MSAEAPKITDEALKAFRVRERNAMLFLRGGGRFSFEEWSKYPAELKAALASAGDRVAARDAAFVAIAALSPEHALAILSIFDGGKAQSEVALSQGVREMVRAFAPRGV